MLTHSHPEDFVSVVETHTCPFHKIAPGEPYPGCTCSGSYYQRLATPEERKANIEARKQADERREKAYAACGWPVSNT